MVLPHLAVNREKEVFPKLRTRTVNPGYATQHPFHQTFHVHGIVIMVYATVGREPVLVSESPMNGRQGRTYGAKGMV